MSLSLVLSATSAWPEVRRGGERYLHELAAALARRGHRVRILTTAPRAGHGEVLGVPVTALPRRRWPRRLLGRHADQLWFGVQALPRAPRDVDAWHALTLGDALAAGLVERWGGPRSVYTAMGVPALVAAGGGWSARAHAGVLHHVGEYVCLSDRATAGLVTDRPVRVVGAGVDLVRFAPAPRRHPQPALLFASDADAPQKNLALLLDACRTLVRTVPDLELWLAGPGDASAAVAAAAPDVAARVTLARQLAEDELAAHYARAWATVLPSRNEAFGMVALESLASGTPAVVLAGEGPASFVDDACGATSAPQPEALAVACARALELATDPMVSETCRERAARHGWDQAVAPALEALYGGV